MYHVNFGPLNEMILREVKYLNAQDKRISYEQVIKHPNQHSDKKIGDE